MNKTCKDCKVEKELSEFYPSQGNCKECFKESVRKNRLLNKEYYQDYDKHRQRYSINRIMRHRYSGMKQSVEGRNSHKRSSEGKDICTQEEFFNWCEENKTIFNRIYKDWKKTDFIQKKSPSIDRIDNTKGYTIDNIEWTTQSKNSSKYTQ